MKTQSRRWRWQRWSLEMADAKVLLKDIPENLIVNYGREVRTTNRSEI